MKKYIIFIFSVIMSVLIHGHGFGPSTLIQLSSGKQQTIDYVSLQAIKKTIFVSSYDTQTDQPTIQSIIKSGKSNVYFYIKIGFDKINDEDIICTLTQEFYIPQKKSWTPAHELKIGDMLLSINNTSKKITFIELVINPIPIYTLEIKKTHTFFVGKHSILTHNMVLPIALSLGFNIPFGSITTGSIGSFFGPIGFVGGIIIGGIASGLITIISKKKIIEYKLPQYHTQFSAKFFHTKNINTKENQEAQAPGIPTEKDGYHPPKKWNGEKVKHPKNGTVGWPDDKGNIWVPSGPKGHGGPHWDVQDPDGGYTNVLPGGRIRGIK